MTPFETAWARTLPVEGDFSNGLKDRGGATRYGVTEAVARENGYTGRMEDYPASEASRVAKLRYWDSLRLDSVAGVSLPVALELFDTGYNAGPGTAGKFLQRSLNALNREGNDYADVAVDGVIGGGTVAALLAFVRLRGQAGELVLLRALNGLQCAHYIGIAEKDRTQETFVFGWISSRVEITAKSVFTV